MRSIKLLMPSGYAILLCSLFLSIFIFSCRKNESNLEDSQNESYEYLIPKIKLWLDKQKNDLPESSVARIDSLKENLTYTEIRLEKYKESKDFIVVPVSNGFKSKNNSTKNSMDYLVMVFENRDSITKGNIIQYISSNGQKVLKNTFTKIFNYQILESNGQFTVLSITDFFRYELKFANGKLKSVTDRRPRTSIRNGSGRTSNCVDWFLITTIYYIDGSSESFDEYLFTSCNGDPQCQNTKMSNGRSLRLNCGGGSGNDIDFEYEKRKYVTWQVVPNGVGGAYVEAWELIRGKASTSQQWPGGGYFIAISHNSSWCNCPGNSVWGEMSGTAVSLLSQGLNVNSVVKGSYTYQGVQNIYQNSKTWFYSDVF